MIMKSMNLKNLNEEILMRFLIDTFDEIKANATVEKILSDVQRPNSDIKLFDSKELSLRFIISCKRDILNQDMASRSLQDDTVKLNQSTVNAKVHLC